MYRELLEDLWVVVMFENFKNNNKHFGWAFKRKIEYIFIGAEYANSVDIGSK